MLRATLSDNSTATRAAGTAMASDDPERPVGESERPRDRAARNEVSYDARKRERDAMRALAALGERAAATR